MSINLLQQVQENLGYPPLKKIDPNEQNPGSVPTADRGALAQAVIPAVLAGMYNLVKTDEGAEVIKQEKTGTDWSVELYGEKSSELMNRIASLTSLDSLTAHTAFNDTAIETARLIREQVKTDNSNIAIRQFVESQRNLFLPYLSDALQAGLLLGDGPIDDRTNKMEGPISSLMHSIESGFNGNETKKTD